MSERASVSPSFATPWLSPVAAISAGLVGLSLLVCILVAPFAFSSKTLESEITAQVRATTGLVITTTGHVRFDLLPRPHIVAAGLQVRDPSRVIAIDARRLEGDVRLFPLLVGRVELTAMTLVEPHLSINLDGQPMRADSTIGRAMQAGGAIDSEKPIGSVTLVDGTAVLTSTRLSQTPTFTAVNVTIDWPSLDSPATLTGSLNVGTTPSDIAAWIAEPSILMRGGHTAMTLTLHSTPLDLAANGDLTIAGSSTFRGHVSASAPSVPAVLAATSKSWPMPARFADLTLASDTTITVDHEGHETFDLPNLHLRIDDNDYEGTLAFQTGLRPLVSGTLACDQLNLAPFLQAVPPLIGPQHQWSETPLAVAAVRPVDLDLRVSANHLRIASFSVDDAALAVMTRDDRIEVGLIEGKAYAGTVRGRMSVGAAESALSLRGSLSFQGVDAATLSWDAVGRQLAAGIVSGSLNLETSGATPAALAEGLGGWAKLDASDGELSTIDLGDLLHAGPARGASVGATLLHGRTPFSRFSAGLRFADGTATLDRGAMSGAEADLKLTGRVSIVQRRVDLAAVATLPGTPSWSQPLTATGPFDQIAILPLPPVPAP